MKHFSPIALFVFTLVLTLHALVASKADAKDIYFDSHWTLWQNADILIWTPDKEPPIDPKEFCLSLRRNNTGIGEPKCRLFGEWERDTVASRYASWLSSNMEPGLDAHYLKARHPAMMAKFQTLEDKIVLYIADKGNNLQVAIFDETSSEPKAAGTVPKISDKIALGDEIASALFDRHTKRRLTKEERLKMETEPDELYKESPTFRSWVGISAGYAQAQIPFTPDSWYKRHIQSRVGNYRVTRDSVSLWNFMDDSTPLFTLYAGGIWFGFIGGEIFYRYSNHDVKIDERDSVYEELDHWDFTQHEIGLNVMFSRTYAPIKWMDLHLFAFLGFQYSFYSEDIELKSSKKKPSKEYETRFKTEDPYKGALLGFGFQSVFLQHYGLSVRTGISSRGKDIYTEPSPDAAAEPTTIGASTVDWFISVGLEYHWTPFK